MRILIADDSVSSRRVLEAMLEKWGYEVVAARSGTEAWEILQRPDAPRLAILDWMMPGLSGPEVCKLVREQQRGTYTYILLVTSRSETEDVVAGMSSGADDYIVKPFHASELKVRLGPALRILTLEQELLAAQEALREQATRDALTHIWNRRAILEILEREISRCGREQHPLGIVMADVDHFKKINDTHGHLAGDAVLVNVSQHMLQLIRPYDSVGRYGGEEFLFVLPGCAEEAAVRHAERLRTAIEAEPIRHEGRELKVTASFGVTALTNNFEAAPDDVIRKADEALYAAKEAGRNRSVFLPFG
jgi:two-component system cell cycle response regulator